MKLFHWTWAEAAVAFEFVAGGVAVIVTEVITYVMDANVAADLLKDPELPKVVLHGFTQIFLNATISDDGTIRRCSEGDNI